MRLKAAACDDEAVCHVPAAWEDAHKERGKALGALSLLSAPGGRTFDVRLRRMFLTGARFWPALGRYMS